MKRMKSNKISKQTNIMDLDESLIITVLALLPIEFINTCSRVCKTWATLIVQPYFIKFYESNRRPPVEFLIEDRSGPGNLVLAQIDEASCTTNTPPFNCLSQSRISLEFLKKYYPNPCSYSLRVFSTCTVTGCIAAHTVNDNDYLSPSTTHIFNPVTGQHIMLETTGRNCRAWWYRCALVFAQKSNLLKLMEFFPRKDEDVGVEIQTIGTNSWRRVGRIPFDPKKKAFPTCADGLYYWMDDNKYVVYSFNAEEEVFEQIQTPPCFQDSDFSGLGLLKGSLCIYIESTEGIEFWVMSVDGNTRSWTKNLVIDNEKICASKILQPLKFLETGEVVILYSKFKAICYNPSTGFYKSNRFGRKDYPTYCYRPIPYIRSLKHVLPT